MTQWLKVERAAKAKATKKKNNAAWYAKDKAAKMADAARRSAIPSRETLINGHIPEAERRADLAVKLRGSGLATDDRAGIFNRVFHTEMDALCKQEGLRV